jgi:hypothetical protein
MMNLQASYSDLMKSLQIFVWFDWTVQVELAMGLTDLLQQQADYVTQHVLAVIQ